MDTVDGDKELSKPLNKQLKSYIPIIIVYGLYSLSFTIYVPALPALMLRLVHDDSSRAAYFYGLAVFCRYITEFLFSPVLGTLTDNLGRKSLLVASFIICAIEYVLLAVYPSILLIFITRIMAGLGDCSSPTVNTMVTDIAVYNGDKVTSKFGLVQALYAAGFVIGPLVGGILMSINISLAFYASAIIASIGGIVSFLIVEDTSHLVPERTLSHRDNETRSFLDIINPLPGVSVHFSDLKVRLLAVPYLLAALSTGLGFVWYIFMDYRYNASSTLIGIYLSVYGVLTVLIQLYGVDWLIPAILTEQQACFGGSILLCLQTIGYGLSPTVWYLFLFEVIFSFGVIAGPTLRALIVFESRRSAKGRSLQGTLQGLLSSINTLATALGSLIFSQLFSYSVDLEHPLPFLSFAVCAFLYLIGVIWLFCVFNAYPDGWKQHAPQTQPIYDVLYTSEEEATAKDVAGQATEADEEQLSSPSNSDHLVYSPIGQEIR